jgi:PAT family beta-lactamase induction signal transducer AmpG
MPLRPLYLSIGVVGSLFTLALILLPRIAGFFALAFIGENGFQSLAFACCTAVVFETIGQNNLLAATAVSFMISAYNVPFIYMLVIDGRAYGMGGVTGAFLVDAGLGFITCLLLGLLLFAVRRRNVEAAVSSAGVVT